MEWKMLILMMTLSERRNVVALFKNILNREGLTFSILSQCSIVKKKLSVNISAFFLNIKVSVG